MGLNIVHPDYVFQKYFTDHSSINPNYQFKSLIEVDDFIRANHHLPGIKSAAEVKKEGVWNLSTSNLQNLEKIEELFLHTIEQEKKLKKLSEENHRLLNRVTELAAQLEAIKELISKE